jgi:Uma2 family endonuclease
MAPYGVVIGPHVVEPDIVVAPRAAFTERDLQTAPLLVVEVRSPSTAWLDEGRKRSLVEEAGVAYYWLADPLRAVNHDSRVS